MFGLRRIVLTAALGLIMSVFHASAGDIYRINNYDTLTTSNRADLETFRYLNQTGQKGAVRALYNNLEARGSLFNLQPGTSVVVNYYFNDGTAKIEWGDDCSGYISKADLFMFLGSR
jgi:hypothetical protein